MSRIIITADSTLDMPPNMLRTYGIQVIPSYVRLGGESFPDYPEVTQHDLFSFYEKTRTIPQTAAASPWDYTSFFKQFSAGDCQIIHISKSSGISSCYNNALLAAKDFSNIRVVDSKNLSGGSGLIALIAAQSDLSDVAARFDYINKIKDAVEGSFIIETLEYLQKGGRCSTLSMLGANALKLRPEITVKDGLLQVGRKYRGSYGRCITAFINDRLSDLTRYEPSEIFVSHSVTDKKLLDEAYEMIEQKHYFKRITVWRAGAGIACHCGPNTFGLFCIKKIKKEI